MLDPTHQLEDVINVHNENSLQVDVERDKEDEAGLHDDLELKPPGPRVAEPRGRSKTPLQDSLIATWCDNTTRPGRARNKHTRGGPQLTASIQTSSGHQVSCISHKFFF